MHFVYFAEKKLERFFDFLVERTEEAVTSKTIKDAEGKIEGSGKATVGQLLKVLGLGGLELQADVSASGKVSFNKETVYKFTAPQKLKALLVKLDSEGKLGILQGVPVETFSSEGTAAIFATKLKTDLNVRSESEIERCKAVVLSGAISGYRLEIQASTAYMESENAWRRWVQPRGLGGFGTLIGIDHKKQLLEVDPIVLGYTEVI